jgi:hypothetical protein
MDRVETCMKVILCGAGKAETILGSLKMSAFQLWIP